MGHGDEASTVDFAGIRALRNREAGYSIAAKTLEVQFERLGHINAPLHEDAQSWYRGTLGEIQVGELLAQLPPEWLVLHSVPFGSAETDIDHLLIGPRGIFCLNTKYHRAASIWVGDHQLRVDNFPQHYLKASVGEAKRVAERMRRKTGQPWPVMPLLVMVDPRSINDKRERQARVPAVLDSKALLYWLQDQPVVLSEAEVGLAQLAAEEPSTWHVDSNRADSLRVMQRFERLRSAVGDPRPVQRPLSYRPRPSDKVPVRTGRGAGRALAVSCLGFVASIAVMVGFLAFAYSLLAR